MIELPIGVFDSGVGGLSVLRRLRKELPQEDFIYFADTAYVPYGDKNLDLIRLVVERILHFMLEKGVKAIIMACNTSSALFLPQKKADFPVPLFGVIEPIVKELMKDYSTQRIGIMANPVTIKSQVYTKLLSQNGRSFSIFSQACPELVPLIEKGETDSSQARQAVANYLAPLKSEGIDTLVLGCTHYPFLVSIIKQIAGGEIKIVDPARSAVSELKKGLEEMNLLKSEGVGKVSYFVSKDPQGFKERAQILLEEALDEIQMVNPPLLQLLP